MFRVSLKYLLLVATTIIILIGAFTAIYVYGNGFNSKDFISRDFNALFLARQSGNCEKFISYVLQDKTAWSVRCEEERSGTKSGVEPIKSFEIKLIDVTDDRAFLQVELQRDDYEDAKELAEDGHKLPDSGYLVNYKMRRVDNRWYLDQSLKKPNSRAKDLYSQFLAEKAATEIDLSYEAYLAQNKGFHLREPENIYQDLIPESDIQGVIATSSSLEITERERRQTQASFFARFLDTLKDFFR